MILHQLILADTGQAVNISVNDGKIDKITSGAITDHTTALQLHFDDAIISPGLINSHDHLDFNLFPQLGNRVYKNYTEWGAYIHQQFKHEIAEVLQVPIQLRILWGIYKNLLCGVTTVVNHGKRLTIEDSPITVYEDTHDLHSAAFEKAWKLKLNNPLKKNVPVVIHTGEGTDEAASDEIDQLIYWNKLRRHLIGIHAVAMTAAQANSFKGLVWCPESNYFLLNKTAPVKELKQHTRIMFGTDSTLTGNWNIWDHINMAHKTELLTDKELYQSLNINAAKVWGLNTGEIAEGKDADLVIGRRKEGVTSLDAFYAITPVDLLLVIHQGNIRLFDQELLPPLAPHLKGREFSLIKISNGYKYVDGNLDALTEQIKAVLPGFVFPVEVIDHQIL
ncbi:amidohydrolase family protein [Mucilaginibacter sp. SP1R1]|uniref:amidohydrolase family protein n=1 Tax=Mucilaginibacter sp. SP1R1 TaxID=2723091 RepID=UPI00160B37E6|nr:amidohydrolase family protein [Mucilaginibacter sp. SP1R1]MBB6151370.1 cytosine/adenosine deaminase-related metal-dependent hydrolase [Mucilaginibacter sp. SP1R1]